jgi:hypothetical protein
MSLQLRDCWVVELQRPLHSAHFLILLPLSASLRLGAPHSLFAVLLCSIFYMPLTHFLRFCRVLILTSTVLSPQFCHRHSHCKQLSDSSISLVTASLPVPRLYKPPSPNSLAAWRRMRMGVKSWTIGSCPLCRNQGWV